MTNETPNSRPGPIRKPGPWPIVTGMGVLLACGVAVGLLLKYDFTGASPKPLDPAFLAEAPSLPHNAIGVEVRSPVQLDLRMPRDLWVAPDGSCLIVGDRVLLEYDADGKLRNTMELDFEPYCVAGVGEGATLLGAKDHIRLRVGSIEAHRSEPLGERAYLTDLAASPYHLFAADARGKVIHVFDRKVVKTGTIGAKNGEHDVPGFVIPSASFSILAGDDGLVRAVNPGRQRIETYTTDGYYEEPLTWGKSGQEPAAFCGCCNPTHIATLSDGRYVTLEKGLPRAKVYSAEGEFQFVIAGPKELGDGFAPAGLGVDDAGRVYLLDATSRTLHVFAWDRADEPAMEATQ